MKRRGFLGALAALVAAPWLPKPLPNELRGCTFAEWEAAGRYYYLRSDRFYLLPGSGDWPPVRTTNGLMLLKEEARERLDRR